MLKKKLVGAVLTVPGAAALPFCMAATTIFFDRN
jgi:hypothetical protein